MKKLIALLVFVTSGALFAAGYGSAGCGLGSMLLGDKPGFVQVFAATTNGTSGSQTFGISSGTSNCGSGGKTPTQFIEVNKAALANEMAKGQGETLQALSEIYGCQGANFGDTMKSNYKNIFATNNAPAINQSIVSTIKKGNLNCRI
jgi:hypothetical protein